MTDKEDIKKFLINMSNASCGTIRDLTLNDHLLLFVEKENAIEYNEEENEVQYCIELLINEDDNEDVFSDIVDSFSCEEESLNIEDILNSIMELVELSREEIIERYF